MNDSKLKGKTVAILATDGFEQSELFEPKRALEEAGADVRIVSLKTGEIKGWDKKDWGQSIKVDMTVDAAEAEEFDGLVLPGGVMNPDKLRASEDVVTFVKDFVSSGKPIAAICHGPWTLIEADAVRGRQMTSFNSIKSDLINAGAEWIDQEVVTDNGLVTSRTPDDLPAFCKKMVEEFAEGQHRGQTGIRQARGNQSQVLQ